VISISLPWLLVAGELFAVLAAALAAMVVAEARRRRRDRQAAEFLVGVVRKSRNRRDTETRGLLQERYGYSGDELGRIGHEIAAAERRLLQRVVNMYLGRDHLSLRELHIDVEGVTEPFRKLDVQASGTSAGSAVSSTDDLAEMTSDKAESLERENEALKQELQITMETMSRMLSEYASMFGRDEQDAIGSTANGPIDETVVIEDEALGGGVASSRGDVAADPSLEVTDGLEVAAAPAETQPEEELGRAMPRVEAEPGRAESSDTAPRNGPPPADLSPSFDPGALAAGVAELPRTDDEVLEDTAVADLEAVWAEALAEQEASGKAS
jgi:hypothetical protein